MESQETRDVMASARVLSYNFNILPRWCGGAQKERINTFLESVDSYDVLLLQEVYATSMLPYVLQGRFCYKRYLIDGLIAKGFHHYVIPRQPSYSTRLTYNVISDNGLVIASRFPIWHRGSYTFPNRDRSELIAKGCLFAEVCIPSTGGSGSRIVFFNVHLRPEERTPSESSQVKHIRRFVDAVLRELRPTAGPPMAFVIAGDFNIHGIKVHSTQSAKPYTDFMAELAPLGTLKDVVLADMGVGPPTRPPKLFFPTRSKLERYDSVPQRQDYFIISGPIESSGTHMEKFVVSSRRPYTYLSDHFGIFTTVSVAAQSKPLTPPQSPIKINLPSMIEEVDHEQSPSRGVYLETGAAILVAWVSMPISLKPLILAVLIWLVVRFSRYTISCLPIDRHFALVTDGVVEGTESVKLAVATSDPLPGMVSLDEMWKRSVMQFRTLKCLGTSGDMGKEEWLSYGAVDTRVRELGAGLRQLGLNAGDLIGVDCDACRSAVILELAAALYGFVTVPLTGRSNTIRSLLDHNKVRLVFAGRSSVASLLTCRSTSLETVVFFHNFADAEDIAAAKDLSISLISYDSVEYRGRTNPVPSHGHLLPSTPFTMSMDNVSTTDFMTLIPLTHADILRDVRMLLRTSVLPTYFQHDSMLWFTPFASLFNRICVLGLLAQGNAIATSDTTHLQEALMRFKPTLLVAAPSLFSTSSLQLSRAKERYSALYNWMFDKAYQFRSYQIHVSNRDSTLARFLFFRSFQNQLGGNVRRIILSISQETTPFSLLEHISVCYAPCLREVSYITSIGICAVDGIPAPGLRVELKPMDDLCQAAHIGELAITREQIQNQRTLGVAARWETDRTLTLLGNVAGILWPVDYQYAVSLELERVFLTSRFVDDVFVFCEPLKPIVTVVYPNRDTVEFEWRQGTNQMEGLGWTKIVEYATDLIKEDLTAIAAEHRLHHSQVPRFIHLHPHAFRDHATFLTPFGRICRDNMRKYFTSVYLKLSSEVVPSQDVVHTACISDAFCEPSEPSTPQTSLVEHKKMMCAQAPFAIDIGGTFAKIAYIAPPNVRSLKLSNAIIHEASSLSETLGLRNLSFFTDTAAAEQELRDHPRSAVGMLRFAKIPSKQIPEFAEYLAETNLISSYKPDAVKNVRATGGGAFKYSTMSRNIVGVSFDVVKELDAVVKGLNLIIKAAPESIFTVEVPSGRHLPHCLVSSSGSEFSPFPYILINIGSGISFIKCLGPDGSHVRVGGSPIGGATFWGLVRTMTSLTSWEEVLEIMQLDGPGDNKNVDLLVGDIYGYNAKDLPAMLSSETVASSFGKFGADRFYDSMHATPVDHYADDDAGEILSPLSGKHWSRLNAPRTQDSASSIDIVRSLLNMIAGNVTQLAYLHSKIHGVKNIFFGGGFVRNNPIIWSQISTTLKYWSSGEGQAHFLEHDGYLGALGCVVANDFKHSQQ